MPPTQANTHSAVCSGGELVGVWTHNKCHSPLPASCCLLPLPPSSSFPHTHTHTLAFLSRLVSPITRSLPTHRLAVSLCGRHCTHASRYLGVGRSNHISIMLHSPPVIISKSNGSFIEFMEIALSATGLLTLRDTRNRRHPCCTKWRVTEDQGAEHVCCL